jgi:hypothetical protein
VFVFPLVWLVKVILFPDLPFTQTSGQCPKKTDVEDLI